MQSATYWKGHGHINVFWGGLCSPPPPKKKNKKKNKKKKKFMSAKVLHNSQKYQTLVKQLLLLISASCPVLRTGTLLWMNEDQVHLFVS